MSEQSVGFLDIHVSQSTDFKTSYASGAFTNLTPVGLINLSFYMDRHPIPDFITHIIEGNKLGPEQERSIKSGIVRELQQGIILDVNAAKSIVFALQHMIEIIAKNPKGMAQDANIQ